MAGESSKGTAEDQVDALIDDLISDIFGGSGTHAEAGGGMASAAALFEGAFGSGRKQSRTSMLEKLFLAQAFATELADALAPALAEQIAPRLISAVEQYMANGSGAGKSGPGARSARSGGQSTRKANGS